MYSNPYHTGRPYTGQSALTHYCPICGASSDCPDAAPVAMPYPPVDPDNAAEAAPGGPLRSYAVTQNGYTTTMRLNDFDAARYGDAAVPTG